MNFSHTVLEEILYADVVLAFPADSRSECRHSAETLSAGWALVEQARTLPPEFSADTLLRLAGSQLVTDKTWQKELIDEAYWSGRRAPLPYQQWADRQDSLPTRQVRANRLETLTLQTRAIEAMLALDPERRLRKRVSTKRGVRGPKDV
jgi:hypothetical protein